MKSLKFVFTGLLATQLAYGGSAFEDFVIEDGEINASKIKDGNYTNCIFFKKDDLKKAKNSPKKIKDFEKKIKAQYLTDLAKVIKSEVKGKAFAGTETRSTDGKQSVNVMGFSAVKEKADEEFSYVDIGKTKINKVKNAPGELQACMTVKLVPDGTKGSKKARCKSHLESMQNQLVRLDASCSGDEFEGTYDIYKGEYNKKAGDTLVDLGEMGKCKLKDSQTAICNGLTYVLTSEDIDVLDAHGNSLVNDLTRVGAVIAKEQSPTEPANTKPSSTINRE